VPDDVPPPKPPSAGGTTRERFAEHARAECARACHEKLDPLGFAFEHYDGIGRYRTMDNGGVVDARGEVLLDGEVKPFKDAIALSAVLAQSDHVRRCFATQWMRFALGRHEQQEDAASIDELVSAFAAADHGVRELILAVARTRSFRYRTPSRGEVLP
jgi:hypothetical protein